MAGPKESAGGVVRDHMVRLDLLPDAPRSPTRLAKVTILPDGSLEMRASRGPWVFACCVVLSAIAAELGTAAALRFPIAVTLSVVTATTVVFGLLLTWGDGGEHLVRRWRFCAGEITREMVLPLPHLLWPRRFAQPTEFEIRHTVHMTLFRQRQSPNAGQTDSVRFRAQGIRGSVTVMTQAVEYMTTRVWGEEFTQDRADEIQRDISPEVLAVAGLLSRTVGVPLYATEKVTWVGITPNDSG